MLGEKLKELREANGLLQRQVAAELQVDTAYISKMENSEKPISRAHLKKLAKIYSINEADLILLWKADKVLQIIEGDNDAEKVLAIVQRVVRTKGK